MCSSRIARPRIRVDFNELCDEDLVLLSKLDEVVCEDGNTVTLTPGMEVVVCERNVYADGQAELIYATGIAELNDPARTGRWTTAARWCCRIDAKGIRVEDITHT